MGKNKKDENLLTSFEHIAIKPGTKRPLKAADPMRSPTPMSSCVTNSPEDKNR